MILAILRAQWLSLRGFGFRRRPAGSVIGLLGMLLFYGFWGLLAFAGFAFFSAPDPGVDFATALPLTLMGIVLYWQVTPAITASMGAQIDLKKLLVYPVPREKLFAIEVMLRVTTAGEMFLVMAGLALGLIRNPQLHSSAWVMAAALLVVLMNLLLSAGIRSLIERVMRIRRAREVLIGLLVFVTLIPQVLAAMDIDWSRYEWLLPTSHSWPWGAAAKMMLGVRPEQSLLMLAAYVWLAYRFGRRQFQKTLALDETSGKVKAAGGRGGAWLDALCRIPNRLLRDPMAAMVEKELRSLLRTPRFRLLFLMGFSFGLLIWLPQALRHPEGFLREHFLTLVSVYSLILLGQVTYWNCFGFDRSATGFYFCAPVPFVRVVQAKNLAIVFFLLAEMLLVTLMTLVIRIRLSGFGLLEGITAPLVAAVYLIGIGNLSSIHTPRPLQAEKVSNAGGNRTLNTLLFLFFPLALFPIGLAYWARAVFHSDGVFFGVLGLAGVLGGVFYWVSLDSAVLAAERLREKMVAELAKGEGPLSTP